MALVRNFLSAVAFLTVLPRAGARGRGAIFFPFIGAILGVAGAMIFSRAPGPAAAFLTAAFWTLIPRVPHEGRIGVFGWAAIALSAVVRWQAVDHLLSPHVLAIFIAAQVVPRAAMVAVAWVSRPAESGLGFEFSSSLTSAVSLAVIAQGAAAAFACGLRPGVLITLEAYLAIRTIRWYFYRRTGGIDANALGAAALILESAILILFTAIRD